MALAIPNTVEPSWRSTPERKSLPVEIINFPEQQGCFTESRFVNYTDKREEILDLVVKPAMGTAADRKWKAHTCCFVFSQSLGN